MKVVFGTGDGVWQLDNDAAEPLGLPGKTISHVANDSGTILAAAPRDGLYETSDAGERAQASVSVGTSLAFDHQRIVGGS